MSERQYGPDPQHHCWYCGVQFTQGATRTKDHVVPRCRGGPGGGSNAVNACKSCNNEKADMSLQEYREHTGGGLFWGEIYHPKKVRGSLNRPSGFKAYRRWFRNVFMPRRREEKRKVREAL